MTSSDPLDPAIELAQVLSEETQARERRIAVHIQLPPSYRGLFPVARNLVHLTNLINGLAKGVNQPFADITAWAAEIDAIRADHPMRGLSEFQARKSPAGFIVAPLHGLYTTHPLWCAMWYHYHSDNLESGASMAHQSSPASLAYQALQAQYLVALVLARRRGKELGSKIYESSLLLRHIHMPTSEWLCSDLSRGHAGPEEMLDALAEAIGENSDKDAGHQRGGFRQPVSKLKRLVTGLRAIKRVIAVGFELSEPEGEDEGDGRARGRGARGSREVRIYPDHSQYWDFSEKNFGRMTWSAGGYHVTYGTPPKEKGIELEKQGLAVDEFSQPTDIDVDIEEILIDTGAAPLTALPKDRPSLYSAFMTARSMALHIAMSNQRLTVQRRRIRLAQIALIVDVLNDRHDTLRNQPEGKEERQVGLMVLRLAAISLVAGAFPQGVRSLRVISEAGELPMEYPLALNRHYGVWVRKYDPPIRNPMINEALYADRANWPRIVLPDTYGASLCLSAVSARPFYDVKYKEYRKSWTQLVRPHLVERGLDKRWCDLESLCEILPSWFRALEEGDHLAVAALFRQRDAMAETQRFYTAWQRDQLAEQFDQVMRQLAASIDLPSRESRPDSLLALSASRTVVPESWVGDDRTPRVESIRDLLAAIRKQVRLGRSTGPDGLYQWHNTVALYTALGLAVVTGFRTVRTPIPDLTAIDRATRTLCLQEKDRADGAHARLVVVPARLLEQIQRYLRHVGELVLQLPLDAAMEIQVGVSKHRDRTRFESDFFTLDLRRTLFFFRKTSAGDWEPEELTGGGLMRECQKVLPQRWLVENAGRHFLRTYLTQRRVPATVINAVLGHWHYGEEPWAPTSAMNPRRYREIIGPHLDAVLDLLEFSVQPES